VLVRARAGAAEPANGRRSGGSTAVSEGGEADRRDPPVSVPQREERGQHAPSAQGSAPGPIWAVSKQAVCAARLWADLRAKIQAAHCAEILFFFFLCNFCLMFEII
jgi:hypothetical protein